MDFNIYFKRLNRYGEDYQTRIHNRRCEDFERYLQKSVYLVTFELEGEEQEGTLEPYSQNQTENLHYLKTRTNVKLPAGTLLWLGGESPWLVYYQEQNKPRGYNSYILLRMNNQIKWVDREGEPQMAWVYLYGQQDGVLKDDLKSKGANVLYTENLKSSFFVTSLNPKINKDDYFTIGEGELKEGFRVTGYDRHSAKGIEYVTIDPVYLFDENEAPHQTKQDNPDDFYWLNGGAIV